MALRPLVFGARLKDRSRSLQVRHGGKGGGYVVEDTRRGKTRRREHASLQGALRDLASCWRGRLH